MPTPPYLRLVPTPRPLPSEETLRETLDRIETTLLALVGDVVDVRRRVESL